MAFFSLFLQADGSGGGGSGGRKNRRGLTTMSLNESRGSTGAGSGHGAHEQRSAQISVDGM